MALPTFNSFALSDSNFIPERIVFKGFAQRSVVRAQVNRREGIKIIATEFGEKKVTIEGQIVGSSASNLQSLIDSMKTSLTAEEADLVIENGRTFKATVESMMIPDEHYNQTKAPFEVTFVLTNPYAEGSQLSVTQSVTSGIFTFSGSVNISGSFFSRPTVVYTPGSPTTGITNITRLDLYHVPTGQTITLSGFNSGTQLLYQNPVTINLDSFTALDGSTAIDLSGSFPRWEPGTNQYTITASGRFPGGSVTLTYKPRYL